MQPPGGVILKHRKDLEPASAATNREFLRLLQPKREPEFIDIEEGLVPLPPKTLSKEEKARIRQEENKN